MGGRSGRGAAGVSLSSLYWGFLACRAPSAELPGEAVVRRAPQEVSGMERGLSY